MSDAALLALIIDDADALRVLAAWASLDRPLSALDDLATSDELGAIAGVVPGRVKSCLTKLGAARVLVDNGITDLADKLLQTIVQQRLDGSKRGQR